MAAAAAIKTHEEGFRGPPGVCSTCCIFPVSPICLGTYFWLFQPFFLFPSPCPLPASAWMRLSTDIAQASNILSPSLSILHHWCLVSLLRLVRLQLSRCSSPHHHRQLLLEFSPSLDVETFTSQLRERFGYTVLWRRRKRERSRGPLHNTRQQARAETQTRTNTAPLPAGSTRQSQHQRGRRQGTTQKENRLRKQSAHGRRTSNSRRT